MKEETILKQLAEKFGSPDPMSERARMAYMLFAAALADYKKQDCKMRIYKRHPRPKQTRKQRRIKRLQRRIRL